MIHNTKNQKKNNKCSSFSQSYSNTQLPCHQHRYLLWISNTCFEIGKAIHSFKSYCTFWLYIYLNYQKVPTEFRIQTYNLCSSKAPYTKLHFLFDIIFLSSSLLNRSGKEVSGHCGKWAVLGDCLWKFCANFIVGGQAGGSGYVAVYYTLISRIFALYINKKTNKQTNKQKMWQNLTPLYLGYLRSALSKITSWYLRTGHLVKRNYNYHTFYHTVRKTGVISFYLSNKLHFRGFIFHRSRSAHYSQAWWTNMKRSTLKSNSTESSPTSRKCSSESLCVILTQRLPHFTNFLMTLMFNL